MGFEYRKHWTSNKRSYRKKLTRDDYMEKFGWAGDTIWRMDKLNKNRWHYDNRKTGRVKNDF